jgi:hypothetical protein
MDFKIENVQADGQYYYVTYSYLDLIVLDSAWQYQLSERTQKVSKKIKQDIGVYMAKFMAKHHEARVRELMDEKNQAQAAGEQKRVEVIEYSGLIGKTLDLAAAVFPGYDPVVKIELPAPENFNLPETNAAATASNGGTDNLTQIYNDYIAAHPEIFMDSASSPQAAPTPADAAETPADTVAPETPADTVAPEIPGIPEPESVNIIELPAFTPVEPTPAPAEPAPTPTPAPEAPAPAEPAPATVR